MALKKNRLLIDLDKLRDLIHEEEKAQNGTSISICTDNVLKEIAANKPLKKGDFLAISGISKDFINKYSSRFIKVISTHQNSSIKVVSVSKKAHKILDTYKDRLTNISNRNPNLYMGKISKRISFDLSQLRIENNLYSFLTNNKISTVKLDFKANVKGEKLKRDIITLYRETNKYFKETGSYDFYIAYPYIEGVFKKDNFAIKAPLLYFPVKLKRSRNEFSIVKDKDKDILYNRDLLLATTKMERSKSDFITPFLAEFNMDILAKTVIPFYKEHGINILKDSLDFSFIPYKSDLKDDFIKRKKGLFVLKEFITLGRYKLYSSMLQKDMKLILDSSQYNELLEGLIDESDLFSKEKDVTFADSHKTIEESSLTYINEINHSQEKVLSFLDKDKKLVIWGPPGTGKSQTITSLIASAVLKGENVLVVSEKKVALDVIYSRLKNSSRYAMFIDDAENKHAFYNRLNAFINPSPPKRTLNNDFFELENEIKEILSTMDKSLDLLYNQSTKDVAIYKLYSRYIKDRDIISGLSPKNIYQMFIDVYHTPLFSDIALLEKTFAQERHLKDYLDFSKMINSFPLLLKLESKISRSNKIEFEEFTKSYETYITQSQKAGFFKKRKLKKQFIKTSRNKLLFMTKKKSVDSKYLKLLINDASLHKYIASNINRLNKLVAKHEKLTKNELLFLDMLQFDHRLKDYPSIHKYRQYLFDAYYTGYLEEIKTKNQSFLYILDKYQEKIERLDLLLGEKRTVLSESFEMELYKYALNFSNTKRIIDIKRSLESKRKISPKAFIEFFQLELMNNIRIWMMTPEVVSQLIPLEYGMFDLVIFDEASQMYVEKGIPSIYRAKKVIIAGDPKQLRPSSLGIGRLDDDDDLYENELIKTASLDAKSLLDLARYKFSETILNYHYRSEYEELIAFSNHAFYEGRLITSPNQRFSKTPPIEYVYVKDGVFHNRENKQEAHQIVKLVKKIFRERENNESIGIITFNSTQRDAIENLIDEEIFKKSIFQKKFEQELLRTDNGEDTSLFIKNIENVQGDERDIIIFSMAYARDPFGKVKRMFGWLNTDGGQNRLNVAISRAKKKIFFVSSLYPEELKVDDLKNAGPKLLKHYMRYCYFISNNNTEMAKKVLYSLNTTTEEIAVDQLTQLITSVKKRLENNKYIVKTSLGIGNESIDLGIYNEETSSFMLGIICDVKNTPTSSARKDLFHMEKYLKTRNWTIYRVFSSNWYVDPNKEMRKIRQLLKESQTRGSK